MTPQPGDFPLKFDDSCYLNKEEEEWVDDDEDFCIIDPTIGLTVSYLRTEKLAVHNILNFQMYYWNVSNCSQTNMACRMAI